MLLSALSVLVVAQSISEIPEGLMNNPVQFVHSSLQIPTIVTARQIQLILYSWFRVSSFYINKIQQDATDTGIYCCKITLRVSGVSRPYHQEYITL